MTEAITVALITGGLSLIGVIITGSEVYHGRIKDKFEPVVRKKMEAYPSEIVVAIAAGAWVIVTILQTVFK